nr:hypothetical protein [Halovivax sp. KZCA124]
MTFSNVPDHLEILGEPVDSPLENTVEKMEFEVTNLTSTENQMKIRTPHFSALTKHDRYRGLQFEMEVAVGGHPDTRTADNIRLLGIVPRRGGDGGGKRTSTFAGTIDGKWLSSIASGSNQSTV